MQVSDFEKEKWNQIVVRYESMTNVPESKIEEEWDAYLLEVFGYSRLAGEIEHQRSVQIGSTMRIIPDIIVKNKQVDLFDLELKKYDAELTPSMEEQLRSYLHNLDLSVGVLVCHALYIYIYVNKELKKVRIDFTKNNPLGFDFVHLFRRQNFSKEQVIEYVNDYNNHAEEIRELKAELSEEYALMILKDFFSDAYSAEAIDAVLSSIRIIVDPDGDGGTGGGGTGDGGASGIGKATAIKLFYRKGYNIRPSATTYAAKNKGGEIYWANPPQRLVHENWYIILDDTIAKKVRLFVIPASTFSTSDFRIRKDKPNYIDMSIQYNDSSFPDIKSSVKLARFLKDTIDY